VPARGAGLAQLLRDFAPAALEESATPTQPVWLPLGERGLPLRLDLCTDFGPPDEDKLCNQDAAAFAGFEAPWPGLVVALADGVSNSPYSEYGARLVVQTAARQVPELLRTARPAEGISPAWWQRCFEQMTEAIRRQMFLLWCQVHASPGDFLPPCWRPDIFVRAVRDKNLFLSTMLVAAVLREAHDRFWGFFAHVGDGGLSFWRDPLGQPQVVDALVCDVQTALDHSLGPAVEQACCPHCSFARLGAQFQLGLATDGVARALPMKELLRRFQQEQRTNGQFNVARGLIEQLKRDCPEQVADNLSLAFVSRSGIEPAPAWPPGA
jgi:hypothetical protein